MVGRSDQEPGTAHTRALQAVVVAGTVAFLLLAAVAVFAARVGSSGLDLATAAWSAGHRPSWVAQSGILVSRLTSPAILIGITVAACLLLWLRGRRLPALVLGGSVLVAYAAGAVLKALIGRPRPLPPVNLMPESEPAFPSGHVLVIATLVVVGLLIAWPAMRPAVRGLAMTGGITAVLLVALDRLVVGAHWLTDVLGSLALATVIAGLAALVLDRARSSTPEHGLSQDRLSSASAP